MFLRSLRRTFLAPVRLFGGICFLFARSSVRNCGLLLAGLLLAGHGLLPSLARPGIGLRPLAVHRQPAAVADALVAADLHLAPDVRLYFAAEVTFDPVGGVDPVTELREVVVGQVVHADVAADPGGIQRLLGAGAADPVDVGEGDLKALLAREVDTDQTCHVRAVLLFFAEVSRAAPRPCPGRAPASFRGLPLPGWPGDGCGAPDAPLTLALLVPRVGADDHDTAMPANDPAFAADLLHARLDLHPGLLLGRARARLFRACVCLIAAACRGAAAAAHGCLTCTGRRSGPGSGRRGSAPRPSGHRAGCGCSAFASSR